MERTPEQQKAYEAWKAENPRRKGTESHYANGKPKVAGMTQKQIKASSHEKALESFKNRLQYKTDTSHAEKKKSRYGWAGDVGLAYRKNHKAPGGKGSAEVGYREDYR